MTSPHHAMSSSPPLLTRRPPCRVALLGHTSPLFARFASQLWSSILSPQGHTLRIVSSWQDGVTDLPSNPRIEHFSPKDFSRVEDVARALRACNHAIVLLEPELPVARSITRLRALAEACRRAETQRLVVVSCGSMISATPPSITRAPGWSNAAFGFPPPAPRSWSLRVRAALELELFRFAADAMDLVTLYPGLVLCADEPLLHASLTALLQTSPSHHLDAPCSLIALPELVRCAWQALWSADAGERYALASCSASPRQLLHAFKARDHLAEHAPAAHPRFDDPLQVRALRLDANPAREKLGLRFSPSIEDLLSEDV